VLDGPLAFGIGARIGIFGAPGCGKSTLLELLVAGSDADATIVALVGERGREAERWISRIDPRTTIVCATSDRSPAERLRAAEVAFAQAEALRARGLHVLLVLDSLARVAAAARDVAVAAGEPVGRGGYPPSIFGVLAGLLERAGNFRVGSITLVATVLVDGADERDPVSEACRAALDGHVVLSDRLARQGWFPAVDLPASASRTLADVAGPAHRASAGRLRRAVAFLDETREARQFGLDPGAGDPLIRAAVANERAISEFLRQSDIADSAQTLRELTLLADRLGDGHSG
jgi:type III secretion protein N (ATPase)